MDMVDSLLQVKTERNYGIDALRIYASYFFV